MKVLPALVRGNRKVCSQAENGIHKCYWSGSCHDHYLYCKCIINYRKTIINLNKILFQKDRRIKKIWVKDSVERCF